MEDLKAATTHATPVAHGHVHAHDHGDACGCAHDHQHDHGHQAPQGTIRRATPKVGRNDPCPCGSGQKHKKCCLA